MLNKIFDMENSFWTFVNKLADVVILELLWLLTSIPLITVGASSVAFWHILLKVATDQEGPIFSGYFRAFRQNIRQGTMIWLLQFASGVWLALDAYICFKSDHLLAIALVGVFGALGLLWLFTSMYLYPLAGRFRFSFKKIIGNSFFLAIRHFPHTLCLLLLPAAAFAAAKYWPYALIGLPALAFYLDARLIHWIFSLYMEKDDETVSL